MESKKTLNLWFRFGQNVLLLYLNYEWMTLRFAGQDEKQIVTWKNGPTFSS